MHFTSLLLSFIFALCVSSQTINPDSVDYTTKSNWCDSSKAQCGLLCSQIQNGSTSTTDNSCDPVRLSLKNPNYVHTKCNLCLSTNKSHSYPHPGIRRASLRKPNPKLIKSFTSTGHPQLRLHLRQRLLPASQRILPHNPLLRMHHRPHPMRERLPNFQHRLPTKLPRRQQMRRSEPQTLQYHGRSDEYH